eukprot:TRINITY_DN4216_c0_g2_i1.p1 TRINITY_DN4216_c0_g2~~TRINITY_DN4216_c0_g2_i1.p1  ORF type:complete len:255 (-),score=71.35 TRINITY_DN4216_c0_g2_i1:138-902(-)
MARCDVFVVALIASLTVFSAQRLAFSARINVADACEGTDAMCGVALFQQQLDLQAAAVAERGQPDPSEEKLNRKEDRKAHRVHSVAENITNLTDKVAKDEYRVASADAAQAAIGDRFAASEQRANKSAKVNVTFAGALAAISARRDELELAASNLDADIAILRRKLQVADATIRLIQESKNFVPSMEEADEVADSARMKQRSTHALAVGGAATTKRKREGLDAEVAELNRIYNELRGVQDALSGDTLKYYYAAR